MIYLIQYLIEFLFSLKTFFYFISSFGFSSFNLIDTNLLIAQIQSIINNFDSLDSEIKILFCIIGLLLLSFIYIIYIFVFVVSPLIIDLMKDHLPLRLKTYLLKFVEFNRKISIPFVIFSFIMIIFILSFSVYFLSAVIYLFKLK